MRRSFTYFSFVFLTLFILFSKNAFAQTQIIEAQQHIQYGMYFTKEIKLPDPTQQSIAVYGSLALPYEADSYYFIPQKDASISIEALTPVNTTNANFNTAWEIIGPNITPQPMTIMYSIPPNSNNIGHDYYAPIGTNATMYDPLSFGLLRRGNQQTFPVLAGKLYYLNIFEPLHYMGDYVIKINNGTSELALPSVQKAPQIIFNAVDNKQIPWIDIMGIFLTVVGIILGCSILLVKLVLDRQRIFFNNFKKYMLWIQTAAIILFGIGESTLYKTALFSRTGLLQTILLLFICAVLITIQTNKETKKQIFTTLLLLSCWIVEIFLFSWYLILIR